MKDSEVLALAAEVIEGGFCKDGYAMNENGTRLDVMSPDARSFCLIGSLARVVGGSICEADRIADKHLEPLLPKRVIGYGPQFLGDFIPAIPPRLYPITPRAWNDEPSRTQAEVAGKLREAAEKARQAGV